MDTTHSTVEYRDVPGFPGYRVGNDGTIWSCWIAHGTKRGTMGSSYFQRQPNVVMKNDGKYPAHMIGLNPPDGGKRKMIAISRLVLLAFVGPPPSKKHHAAHENNNPADNRLTNLAWKTAKENNADQISHGTRLCGVNKGRAKLTDEKVLELIAARIAGESCASLADRFGINVKSVYGIMWGERWTHIVSPERDAWFAANPKARRQTPTANPTPAAPRTG